MKKKGLLQNIATFGSLTFLSRILGLVRDVIIGTVFGPSAATDAFFVAFKIPNFMRRLFAEGAFSQAFVPVLAEYKSQRSQDEVRQLVSRTIGVLGTVLTVITLLGMLGAPWVVSAFAPGFSDEPDKYELAVELLRYTFPYILFISLVACAGGVLNTYGQFGPPAFAPVLLNLTLIAGALWSGPFTDEPIKALGVAVLVAGVLQLLLQLPYLAKLGLLTRPRWGWKDSGVRKIMRLMGPAIFGSSVAQINLLVDTILASFLITGSVTWLYFSDRMVEFPLGIFGVALGTVILPRLSSEFASKAPERFSNTLDWALRWVVLIAAPATVGLVLLSAPILSTLFQYGQFTAYDVRAAGLSLSAYALGLSGFILVKVAAPGYFARQDMKTPVVFAAISMVLNMILSIAAVLWLRDSGVGHVGLAFATACAATLNAALLLVGLRRSGVYRASPGWWGLLAKVGFATVAMGALLAIPATNVEWWLEGTLWLRIGYLLGWIGLAVLLYFGCLALLRMPWRTLRAPAPS
ncbi:murein biosynthesis integral membrane protein MurJ [Alkalilimnicola ehrlichii]|uniref:Probable lipid II flippase MurJ n=1 Tax=Alkalilimnicola ehrlichii TaxID=351052 RepID=A0A3E0WYP4_9GAMM|nr:murein biosynthesis integral membrane protein MurJ [Alkalilimnicola ehrlichii]RFA30355.1 murein biosynthesis integral membrane protein MurJ [Alkalilimnicola ehrlichii]RFA37928.1 murein biosynthesis integral membrane protein MurJ [Alkalilimnicola ehrlichii]